jgi:hypothetical protein
VKAIKLRLDTEVVLELLGPRRLARDRKQFSLLRRLAPSERAPQVMAEEWVRGSGQAPNSPSDA